MAELKVWRLCWRHRLWLRCERPTLLPMLLRPTAQGCLAPLLALSSHASVAPHPARGVDHPSRSEPLRQWRWGHPPSRPWLQPCTRLGPARLQCNWKIGVCQHTHSLTLTHDELPGPDGRSLQYFCLHSWLDTRPPALRNGPRTQAPKRAPGKLKLPARCGALLSWCAVYFRRNDPHVFIHESQRATFVSEGWLAESSHRYAIDMHRTAAADLFPAT